MTLTENGADILIDDFGETVTVYPHNEQVPEDSSDPIFFEEDTSSVSGTDYTVRLYTAPSEELMKDYGFDEETEAMMYTTSNIAEEGDKVEYSGAESYEWIVKREATNQIGEGPYMFVYSMKGV